mmetsp:Transcript_12360/g.14187  ORF Transcript_12360/g.14187 Transcript_12360/m.14187 type:complete len:101 (-) Transcript_12360:57-359(-)
MLLRSLVSNFLPCHYISIAPSNNTAGTSLSKGSTMTRTNKLIQQTIKSKNSHCATADTTYTVLSSETMILFLTFISARERAIIGASLSHSRLEDFYFVSA